MYHGLPNQGRHRIKKLDQSPPGQHSSTQLDWCAIHHSRCFMSTAQCYNMELTVNTWCEAGYISIQSRSGPAVNHIVHTIHRIAPPPPPLNTVPFLALNAIVRLTKCTLWACSGASIYHCLVLYNFIDSCPVSPQLYLLLSSVSCSMLRSVERVYARWRRGCQLMSSSDGQE